jgi:hypothetical protein
MCVYVDVPSPNYIGVPNHLMTDLEPITRLSGNLIFKFRDLAFGEQELLEVSMIKSNLTVGILG